MGSEQKMQAGKQHKLLSILNQEPRSQQKNAFCFVEGNCLPRETAGSGVLAFLQDFLKQNGRTYYFLVDVISPVKRSEEISGLTCSGSSISIPRSM
jgi:hypothetical protein